MKNYAQELFLLITTLSQLRNKDRTIQLFIESLNDVFQDYSFSWVPEKPIEYDTVVEVCTRNKNYGYILFIANKVPDAVIFDLIRNTSQLLALLLEKLEQDELLLDQKNHLQTLVDERTNELQKINLKLEEELAERRRVEKALAESSIRYRELFENANIAIFQSTLDGKVIMVNPEFAHMFGYQSPEEVATTVRDVGTDIFADPQRRAEIIVAIAEHPDLNEFENLYRRKDGSTFLGKLHVHSVMDSDGRMLYFEGFIEDITGCKLAEEALRISEGRYRKAQTMGRVGNWEYNLQTNEFWGSDEAKLLYGFDLEQPHFTTDEVENCIPGRERVHQALVDLIEADKPYNLEFKIHPKNSLKPRTLFSVAELKRDEHGNPLLVMGVIQDITDRKQAEVALRESENRMHTLVQTIPDLIWLKDTDGVYRSCNKMFERFFGARETDIVGKTDYDFVDRKLADFFREHDRSAMAAGKPTSNEELVTFADDGHRAFLETIKTPVYDDRGTLIGVLGIGRDITKRKEAEVALHTASIYARSLIEASLDPLVTISADGKITDVNLATESVTGVGREQLIFSDFSDYFTEPGKARVGYQRVLAQGLVRDYPLTIRHISGKTTDVLYNATVYKTESGEIQGVFAAARDITALKRAEQKAIQLASIVESSEDAIIGKSLEGVILSWNKGAEKIYGYTENEVIGKSISILLSPRHPDEVQHILKKIKSGEHIEHFETMYRRKDGKDIHVALTVSPIRDTDGRIVAASTIGRDITARKEAEDALRNSEDDLKEAQRLGRLGSWNWDITTDTITWSKEYYHIYGLNPTQRPPRYEEHLKVYTPESAARLDEAVKRNVQTGEPYEVDLELSENMEYCRWITARSETKYDDNGQIVGLRGTAQDITGRKQAEQEIHKLNQELENRVADRTSQLEAANKELEAFAYSVSHDLRAPLRYISGFVDMLSKDVHDQLSEKSEHYLNVINDSALKMGKLIDDLLSFSRTGRAEMEKTTFSMNQVVEEAKSQVKLSITHRNIDWKIANLPEVFGDYNLLRLVWVNLLDNAVKYTRTCEKAVIHIDCSKEKEEFVFSIRDNGVGFDMKYAHKLFGVFQRLHSASEFEGTGIGLANVRRIILRHGGHTWAEAELNKGATFYFTLPR